MTIEEVEPGDGITADWANEVAKRADREIVGPNVLQTPDGVYIADGAAAAGQPFRWCIVREIANDADLAVRIEYAQRGRDYAVPGEDFGRWVGDHEYLRTGPPDALPDPIPTFDSFLIDANVFPHTVAHDWRYALYPDPANSEDALYRATHVDDTDIILAMMVGGNPILIPVYRDANGEVAETTRQYDCTVEAP